MSSGEVPQWEMLYLCAETSSYDSSVYAHQPFLGMNGAPSDHGQIVDNFVEKNETSVFTSFR